MTIKELIKLLSEFPLDYEVFIDNDEGYCERIISVEKEEDEVYIRTESE